MSPVEGEAAVTQAVQGLEALDLAGLQALWKTRYGQATTLRSTAFLKSQLAWRMQAEALGGMDEAVLKMLAATVKAERGPKLQSGSRLAREWKGRRIEVEVSDGRYVCDGVAYSSLSQVARAVTGVRWNGPRFFGLRTETNHAA